MDKLSGRVAVAWCACLDSFCRCFGRIYYGGGLVDLAEVWPIASGVMTELAAEIVISVPGWTMRKLRASPEGSALRAVVAESAARAFLDAAIDGAGDDAWLEAVARMWVPAFTPMVCGRLLAALGSSASEETFQMAALDALRDAGGDIAELRRILDAEEFLFRLPRYLYDDLRSAALAPKSTLRDTVHALLEQRTTSAIEAQVPESSPREFREDLTALLNALESDALCGGLPRFLPQSADITRLTSMVRVRQGVRSGPAKEESADTGSYDLAADGERDEQPVTDWGVVAQRENRIVVLADAGIGKSWLVRCETARLARTALEALGLGARADQLLIPLPMRCDDLVAGPGTHLAEAATRYIVERFLVPERSRRRLQEQVARGQAILLLDALDELPDRSARKRLDDLMRRWAADPRARFRLTSRIAGYTGIVAPPSSFVEVELLPFTTADVSAVISARALPADVGLRLRERLSEPAMVNLARIPLLTVLLCAIAEEDRHLPASKADIYERVLRRFLTQENRWPQAPEPESTDIDRLVGVLAPLAFHFATRPGGWADRMPGNQIMAFLRSLGPMFTELGRDAATLLRELSVDAGVLVPAGIQRGGHNPPYLFFHRAIAEYLVACHVATLPRQEWLTIVDEHLWFDGEWRPSLFLLGTAFIQQERPGEVVFLLRHLMGQAADPFNQALFRAARVVTELPDHTLVPPDLADDMSRRLIQLLDCEADRDNASDFLSSWLTRLPQQVTQMLLARLEADEGYATERILANSRDPWVTSALITRLDGAYDQADAAFAALHGQDADCFVDALLTHFDNPKHRIWAAEALQGCSAAQIVPVMLERTRDPHPRVRYYALMALGSRDDEHVIDRLCELVADPDEEMRTAAISVLSARHTAAATEAMLGRFDDADPLVRTLAMKAVFTGRRLSLTQIQAYSRHPSAQVRSYAATALGAYIGEEEATQTLLILIAGPEELQVRVNAIESLANSPGTGVADVLLGLLDDEACRLTAARALQERGNLSREQVDALCGRLAPEATTEELLAILTALKDSAGHHITDAFLRYVEHPDSEIREIVVSALAACRGSAVTGVLLTRLAADSSGQVRRAAATALQTRQDEPDVAAALLAHLSDDDPEVQDAVIQVIEVSERNPAVMRCMLGLLVSSSEGIRNRAAATMQDASIPDVLLAVCDLNELPAAPALPLLFRITEELANQFYRVLPRDAQDRVLSRLAMLTERATQPTEPFRRQPSGRTYENQGTGYLDEEIVIFLSGNNMYGHLVYSYVLLTGRKLRRLFEAMRSGINFKPADFGKVLAAGTGQPTPELVEEMRVTYNMKEVPAPKAWPGQDLPPLLPGSVVYVGSDDME